jgi:hypothetical protein
VLVLFDHGTPKGLALVLSEHTVHTAQSKGWDTLDNGALLNAAEGAGFDLLLTTDRRIRYQQNLKARRIALVVLTGSTRWSVVRQHDCSSCSSRKESRTTEIDSIEPPQRHHFSTTWRRIRVLKKFW